MIIVIIIIVFDPLGMNVSDIGGQGDKSVPYAKRPCVGLCYILKMKTKGIKVIIDNIPPTLSYPPRVQDGIWIFTYRMGLRTF